MSPFALYARSRYVPAAAAACAAGAAVLWALAHSVDELAPTRFPSLSAVALVAAVAAGGLAGADVDLDRTAAIDWRPRRAAHVALIAVAITATAAPVGPFAETARNAGGAAGLVALAAATVGPTRAWIPPVVWLMTSSQLLAQLWPADPPPLAQALTWPAQPPSSAPALLTAAILSLVGTATYTTLGPT